MVGGDDRTLPCAITKREPRSADDYASPAQVRRRTCAPTSWRCRKSTDPRPPRRCFRATTSASARARTRRRTASRSAAACHSAASRSTSRCRSTTPCVAASWRRSSPARDNEFRLMSVHLKSGCPAGPLTAPGRNCELLTRQVAPLEAWIDGEARAGHRFGLFGDFNRRFSIEKGPARDAQGRQLNVYAEIADGDPPAAKLTNVTGAARSSLPARRTANTASTSTTSSRAAIWRRAC